MAVPALPTGDTPRKTGTATNSRLWNWLAVPALPTADTPSKTGTHPRPPPYRRVGGSPVYTSAKDKEPLRYVKPVVALLTTGMRAGGLGSEGRPLPAALPLAARS